MKQGAEFLAEMDPFAWAPADASRIAGLGGRKPPSEGAYAFRTAPLAAPTGIVTVTIRFTGLQASRGTLMIEVAGVEGGDRRQMGLRTVSLADLAATGGTEQISFASGRRDMYAVAGHIYDDTDAAAEALTVEMGVGDADPAASVGHGMARVSRLAGVEPPSFTHPASQTFSRQQLREEAFHAACRNLGLAPDAAAWPAAFVLQVLGCQLDGLADRRGLGVGASVTPIAQALTAAGARVMETESFDPGQWPAGGDLDFAWLNVAHQPEPPLYLFVKACSLIERLRIGGVLAMVFPLEHGLTPRDPCDVLKRSDIEIIALKMLAGGHGLAQLKFRTADGLLPAGVRTPFGMVVHRME